MEKTEEQIKAASKIKIYVGLNAKQMHVGDAKQFKQPTLRKMAGTILTINRI